MNLDLREFEGQAIASLDHVCSTHFPGHVQEADLDSRWWFSHIATVEALVDYMQTYWISRCDRLHRIYTWTGTIYMPIIPGILVNIGRSCERKESDRKVWQYKSTNKSYIGWLCAAPYKPCHKGNFADQTTNWAKLAPTRTSSPCVKCQFLPPLELKKQHSRHKHHCRMVCNLELERWYMYPICPQEIEYYSFPPTHFRNQLTMNQSSVMHHYTGPHSSYRLVNHNTELQGSIPKALSWPR